MVRDDPEVKGRVSGSELDAIFDYGYYVRHVDAIFERVGL